MTFFDIVKMGRGHICNVVYTIVGDQFKRWVEQKVNERHARMLEEQDTI